MNIVNEGRNPSLPGELFYQPPGLVGFPFNIEVWDDWQIVGSGIGNASTSVQAAVGEYYERRHFYMEVTATTRSTLQQALGKAEAEKFIGMFGQTAIRGTCTTDLAHHIFNMSDAIRISDFTKCRIPTICISLSHHGNPKDNHIYPDRDTCGCSFHSDYESAFFGAIKEALERQFLLRFWLTKQCSGILSHQEICSEIKNSSIRHLYDSLHRSGEVVIINLTDNHFPGFCLLGVYGTGKPDRNVKYCAGMSYAETKLTAIEKSICELWQTFRYMHLFAELDMDISQIRDSYLRHFMLCNSYATFKEITDLLPPNSKHHNQPCNKKFNFFGLTKSLKEKNIEGYLYTSPITIESNSYICCKFISPSIFMHMNNAGNINFENEYTLSFADDITPSRRAMMVPFP